MKKIKGFTLSELMVSLAVIGILVAVVTPTIMKTRPDKNKMMIKKAYYITENVVTSLINDTTLYPDNTFFCSNGGSGGTCYYGFDDENSATYEGTNYSGKTKFPKLFAAKLNVKNRVSDYKYETSDGIKWIFDEADNNTAISNGWTQGTAPANNCRILLVDVNGDAAPNALQASDPDDFDRFRIEICSNGKMKVKDDDSKAQGYVTINASVVGND